MSQQRPLHHMCSPTIHTYIHIYIYIYVHTHIHVYIYTYIQMHMDTMQRAGGRAPESQQKPSYYMCSPPIHTYIHVHTYIYTYTYIHNTHIYIHTNVHGYAATSRRQGTWCLSKGPCITCARHPYIHTYIYIYIYTYIHTHMYTHIHTYKCTWTWCNEQEARRLVGSLEL